MFLLRIYPRIRTKLRVLLEYSCRKAQIKDIDLVPAIPYANKCADKIKL